MQHTEVATTRITSLSADMESVAHVLPRSVHFVADLPKTPTGKIMRRQLRTLD